MSILKASSEDPTDQLPELVHSEEYRSTFLKLARNLAPTGKNFSQVEVRSADETQGISLGPENRKEINLALRPQGSKTETQEKTSTELRGVLRALNLEKDWLEVLLTDGQIVHVDGLNEAVDDVIGPMVNRPVIVQSETKTEGSLAISRHRARRLARVSPTDVRQRGSIHRGRFLAVHVGTPFVEHIGD